MTTKELKKLTSWLYMNENNRGCVNTQELIRFCKSKLHNGLRNGDYVRISSIKDAKILFSIEDKNIDKETLDYYSEEAYDEGFINYYYFGNVLKYGQGTGEELEIIEFKNRAKVTF